MKRNFWIALSLVLIAVSFVSCSSAKEEEKRNEVGKIIESRSSRELMNDLYMACDGDVESLARMLQITPSSIERLRKGETIATPDFEELLKDVASYYFFYGRKYSKLRSVLDPEYKWYCSIRYFYTNHSRTFWIINIVLMVLFLIYMVGYVIEFIKEGDTDFTETFSNPKTTFLRIVKIFYYCLYIVLLEFFIWLVALIILSVKSPKPAADNYIDTINPVIERLL